MVCRMTSIHNLTLLVSAAVMLAVGPAAGQTANNVVCTSCVGTGDLGFGAVTTAKIKAGAITASRIRNGNITSDKFGFGAVTRPKIAIGAVNSSRMDPNISLGTAGNDGDFSVENTSGAATVSLDGQTGNVTNRFANTAATSNGLVKAWAKINADGTIDSCWRCPVSHGKQPGRRISMPGPVKAF